VTRSLPASSRYGARAPLIWGFQSHDRLTWIVLACLFSPLAVAFWHHGMALIAALWVSLMTAVVWQAIFSEVRKRPQRRDVLIAAVIFPIVAGTDVSLLRMFIGLSFGFVLGDLVFGGRGFGFLNAAVVALAFVTFAFPAETFSPSPPGLAAASIPGALVLVAMRFISWRMIAGFTIGFLCTGYLMQPDFGVDWLAYGHLPFILFFLACDPMSSAATNAARWANGGMIGGLSILFAAPGAEGVAVQAMIPAVLLGSLFAPLLDRLVIAVNVAMRARGHG
jgi:Na+-transporting NADH:ubiquinone oxidoreductase subunit B